MTISIDDLIHEAGGSYRIAREAEKISSDGRTLTPSAVRYWRSGGIPSRWYGLMADLTGRPVEVIHAVVSNHLNYPRIKRAS